MGGVVFAFFLVELYDLEITCMLPVGLVKEFYKLGGELVWAEWILHFWEGLFDFCKIIINIIYLFDLSLSYHIKNKKLFINTIVF
jgi:hypothetical protein